MSVYYSRFLLLLYISDFTILKVFVDFFTTNNVWLNIIGDLVLSVLLNFKSQYLFALVVILRLNYYKNCFEWVLGVNNLQLVIKVKERNCFGKVDSRNVLNVPERTWKLKLIVLDVGIMGMVMVLKHLNVMPVLGIRVFSMMKLVSIYHITVIQQKKHQ